MAAIGAKEDGERCMNAGELARYSWVNKVRSPTEGLSESCSKSSDS